MLKNKFKYLILGALVLIPAVSSAAIPILRSCRVPAANAGDILCRIGSLLNNVIPVLVILGVVYFVFGVVQYVIGSDEEAKKKGRDRIVFGIIGFAIILGMWGLVSITLNTFGLQNSGYINDFVQNIPEDTCDPSVIGGIICKIGVLLSSALPLLVGLGVLYFIWGVVQYVIGDDEEAKKKGRDRIIYGIVGLAIIVSFWGLVSIIVDTFGLQNNTEIVSNFVTNTNTITNSTASGGCDIGVNPKVQNIINYATCIISGSVIPLIFALAVLMFVWGVIQYVINDAEEAKKDKGRQFMIWGIIALAVMVSVWGLVRILGSTFGIEYAIPQVKPR